MLDMRGLVAYTDFLVICTARNERQARAIVDEVRLRLKRETGCCRAAPRAAATPAGSLLDYLDCVLHVFTAGGARALPARGAVARGAAARARSSTSPRRRGRDAEALGGRTSERLPL